MSELATSSPVTSSPVAAEVPAAAAPPASPAPPSEAAAGVVPPPTEAPAENVAKLKLEWDLKERKMRKQLKEAEALRAKASEYEQHLAALKANPLDALGKAGVTLDQFLVAQAQGAKKLEPTETEILKQEIETLKQERQRELAERQEYMTKQQHAQAVGQLREQIQKDARFPLTAALDYAPVVLDRIASFYQEHGSATPEDQARIALSVESELERTLDGQIQRLASTERGKALFLKYIQAQAAEAQAADSTQSSQPSQQENGATRAGASRRPPSRKPKSLTNRDATTVDGRTPQVGGRGRDRERVARALAAWRDS